VLTPPASPDAKLQIAVCQDVLTNLQVRKTPQTKKPPTSPVSHFCSLPFTPVRSCMKPVES